MTKYFLSPRSGTITIRPDFCVLFKKMKCVSNHVELHDLSSLYSRKVPTFFSEASLIKKRYNTPKYKQTSLVFLCFPLLEIGT